MLLTEVQIAALGGATASGIPIEVVQPDADFNDDGQVDGRDLLAWQRGFGLASGASRAQEFGPRFVELARAVYRTNDRRAQLKRAINELLGSQIIEEKQYVAYDADR